MTGDLAFHYGADRAAQLFRYVVYAFFGIWVLPPFHGPWSCITFYY